MKNLVALSLIVFVLLSCKKETIEKPLLPSTEIHLTYPQGIGSSGDGPTALLGYGYDATGLRDTISVKAKVVATFPANLLCIDYPNSAFSTTLSASNFMELSEKVNDKYNGSTLFSKHLEALLKLANKSEVINDNYAFTYYSLTGYTEHLSFYPEIDWSANLHPQFKQDIINLKAQQIVEKYGTHVLNDIFMGYRFEILYFCKSGMDLPLLASACENQCYTRMKQFMGGIPMVITESKSDFVTPPTNETMIYNNLGSTKKMCGLINITDYNPDSIRLDLISPLKNENIKYQFISVGSRGLLPLYEFIQDETKKLEVKAYIDQLIMEK